jgi:hypothetical protein
VNGLGNGDRFLFFSIPFPESTTMNERTSEGREKR